jgi:hypothetical protein
MGRSDHPNRRIDGRFPGRRPPCALRTLDETKEQAVTTVPDIILNNGVRIP